jgi:hypothetical protein
MNNPMMQQIQKLQQDLVKAQEALGDERVTATAGGGAVTVVMDGHQEIQSIEIAPEVVDPDDIEMLQDLIVAAVREATEQAKALAEEKMGDLGGGLNIPGLM